MKIYTVFLRDTNGRRLLDTSWVQKKAAESRQTQINASMKASNFGGDTYIVEMTVEDCEIK